MYGQRIGLVSRHAVHVPPGATGRQQNTSAAGPIAQGTLSGRLFRLGPRLYLARRRQLRRAQRRWHAAIGGRRRGPPSHPRVHGVTCGAVLPGRPPGDSPRGPQPPDPGRPLHQFLSRPGRSGSRSVCRCGYDELRLARRHGRVSAAALPASAARAQRPAGADHRVLRGRGRERQRQS